MPCPVWPCPYCILGLYRNPDFEDIIDAWDNISADYQTSGGCEFSFAIQRIAYLWLAQAEQARLPAESLMQLAQDPARPIRWDPPGRHVAPPGTHVPASSSMIAPPQTGTTAPATATATSSASSRLLPPPPAPPGSSLASWLDQEPPAEAEERPQFDWHTEKKSGKRWVPFQPEHQAQLRAALREGQRNVVLDVDGYSYDVDLTPGQESQVARHTEFRRRIRVRSDSSW